MSKAKRRHITSAFSLFVKDAPPADIAYRHVSYQSHGSSLRRSTGSVLLPPLLDSQSPAWEPTWNDEYTTSEQNSLFPPDSSSTLPDPGNFGDLDIAYINELSELDIELVKKRNRTAADEPLASWLPFRQQYLLQLLRKAGRGQAASAIVCPGCSAPSTDTTFRCLNCLDEALYCEQCIVINHRRTPFHRIERWTEESYFVPHSLKALGLRIQLGHDLGKICLNPTRAKADTFMVIDVQGIHEVGLDFCGCQTAQPLTVQLLQRGLFPSTVSTPQTAASFQVQARVKLEEDCRARIHMANETFVGNTLLRRLKEAIPQCSTHVENHRELEAHLEPATILEWRSLVESWEADNSKPNPYMAETTTLSQDAVRLQLANEEAEALAAGTLEQLHLEVTPLMYIASGLDLELQQHQLLEAVASLGQHATDRQCLAVVNRANTLCMKISNFHDVQKLYCLSAFRIVAQANDANETSSNPTEDVARLWLCLPSTFRTPLGCSEELRAIEWQLRYAQALDALNALRVGLHLRVSVFHYKDRFDRGQRALTRSMGNISRVQGQIDRASHRYRVARAALSVLARFLGKDDSWRAELQELKTEDIRGLGVADIDNLGEGYRTISWIWRTAGTAGNEERDDGLHSSLCLEWCKSRARALRWSEEVLLLQEEMRRVLAFLRWQAEWWKGQICDDESIPGPEVLREGLNAYARQQANVRTRLAGSFEARWACVPQFLELYNPLHPPEGPPT
ncbi:hypothetical protein PC9H_001220 [Pleurotus ostreatus]|uniref:CxC2-like cysteine cluster KDZ transposase-associated domain-containing protein n=1 Tax=Pleurotus ostreatus TaxID=5322 RepID=A0A8H7DXA9_PLEOS|nr:uncharacterized protein PC9H_001220 [Pleurotus ostreatus]KAF7440872.1 hypothetical protein PC9H_001220 [Pleurotus ostreatus]